jgi:DNA-binding phage protein
MAGFYEGITSMTNTTRYDVAEHLRTLEEMTAYWEACLEEANGDAAFIAKALTDIARAKKSKGGCSLKQ